MIIPKYRDVVEVIQLRHPEWYHDLVKECVLYCGFLLFEMENDNTFVNRLEEFEKIQKDKENGS